MNRIRKLGYHLFYILLWALRYSQKSAKEPSKPTHIIFCMVDHFEPGTGQVTVDIERGRIRTVMSEFPKLVKNHKDHFGNLPKRTWFFPPHYHRNNNLRDLVSLCERGYGEIELHLHHGNARPDTAHNLERTIRQCIDEYSSFGIFGSENGRKAYGFIHGDWALDNSRHGRYCGVNNEIEILRQTGCYADFTFPSKCEADPIRINSIYYAQDNPEKPKSHNRGIPVRVLGKAPNGLMIIQGPLHPFFYRHKKLILLKMFGDHIDGRPPVNKKRIDFWVKTGIHVKGREDWIIIKTHTHGAVYMGASLGKEMDRIYRYLESRYNDGYNYILHYVTARELYNIIKAIESGEMGNNPEKYRNYKIKPPKYDSSPKICEASEKLKELVNRSNI